MSNLDSSGRPLKVGVDKHARACAFGECLCGLTDRVDGRIADRNNPFRPWRNIVAEAG